MGCGVSSVASTSVLEPRQVKEMQDSDPHRAVALVAQSPQAPLRVIRFEPENSEALERRAGIGSSRSFDGTSRVTSSCAIVAQYLKEAGLSFGVSFSPRPSSPTRQETGIRLTRCPDKDRCATTPSQRTPTGSRASHPGSNVCGTSGDARVQSIFLHRQPMRVSEQRGKQPHVIKSSHDNEGLLPRKLPPIRRPWTPI